MSVRSRDCVSSSTGSSKPSNITAPETFKILPTLFGQLGWDAGNEEVGGHQVNNQGCKEEKFARWQQAGAARNTPLLAAGYSWCEIILI